MRWVSKVVAPAVLVAGVAAAVGFAQPPRGENPPDKKGPPGDKRGPGGDDRRGPQPGGERGQPGGERREGNLRPGAGPARPDPSVEAWVKTLAEKMNDPHDVVRDSARAGLLAAGPAAVPTLERLANGDDGARAHTARHLIGQITRGPMGRGPEGRRPGGEPMDNRGPGNPPAGRGPEGAPRGENPGGRPDPEGRPGAPAPAAPRRPVLQPDPLPGSPPPPSR